MSLLKFRLKKYNDTEDLCQKSSTFLDMAQTQYLV